MRQTLGVSELRYERLESELIHENPDFKSIDESLTLKQRTELLGLAAALDHYYPGQYAAVLGDYTDPEVNNIIFRVVVQTVSSAVGCR